MRVNFDTPSCRSLLSVLPLFGQENILLPSVSGQAFGILSRRSDPGSVSVMGIFRQLPIGALLEPRATIPSCSISAIRKQVATGSSILRGRLLQYSLSGGCCDSMCCSARRHARDNEISRYTGARVLSVIDSITMSAPTPE